MADQRKRTRNSEASRQRILDAAMAEFSAHGIAGARVDRIAAAAGCNKNLIYIYFESKDKLFQTVSRQRRSAAYDQLPLDPEDLPAFAVRLFDLAMENPDLMRLIAWHNLEREPGPVTAERAAGRAAKTAQVARAQKAGQLGTALPAGFLMSAIVVLATAWSAANAFASTDAEATRPPAVLRRNLAKAVRLLTGMRE
jgi:AcrR family transcriptional regulator